MAAYGNASAGRQIEEVFVPYRRREITKLAGTLATRIWKGNALVTALGTTEGVQNAADTANFVLVGIAADNQSADAAVGDLIEFYPRGSVLWMPTIDTNTLADTQMPCFVMYGTDGTPQLVTSGTAGVTAASNQIGCLGYIEGWRTGYYLVNTTLMGTIPTATNFEIT